MHRALFFVCLLSSTSLLAAREQVRLANSPALSPDGKTLAFAWSGEIWSVPSEGGVARRLTAHPAEDGEPHFSPDGQQIAFISDRAGGRQVFVMSADGTSPRQVTFHSEGCSLQGWFPAGDAVLVLATRDHFWRRAERFCKVNVNERRAEQMLFDDHGHDGDLSADGKKLLFAREGTQWWRKGYHGSQASQVWLYDIAEQRFENLVDHPQECRAPLWKPDGEAFYYVGGQGGAFNLWERDMKSGAEKQLTQFEDDSVVQPCISRDGSTIVFRHLFDLHRLLPGQDAAPHKLEIFIESDRPYDPLERRVLSSASDAAFTNDGLEIAFIAGGDLWVMDTELREPKQVTRTPQEEREPVFSPDGKTIYFLSDAGEQCDVWKAARGKEEDYWWRNQEFVLQQITKDAEAESDLTISPTGELLAFLKGRGDLYVMETNGDEAKRLVESWGGLEYDWSPDGKWFVYAKDDDDFNRDIWIAPLDGKLPPFNVSRHPDNDFGPKWSPDGKTIAYAGRQYGEEVDIYFVPLTKKDDQTDSRDRRIKKALEKMKKGRSAASGDPSAAGGEPGGAAPMGPRGPGGRRGRPGDAVADQEQEKEPVDAPAADAGKQEEEKKPPEVKIDFDGLHERVRRVAIANSTETNLLWSHDSKTLAFAAEINGQRGMYGIEPPEELTPKLLSGTTLSDARWLAKGNQIVGLDSGVPVSLAGGGSGPLRETRLAFTALAIVDLPKKYAAAFDLSWRTMRDNYYDGALNNRNWDEIRRKYRPLAEAAPDTATLATVINLMLGELNGSHLGFIAGGGVPAGPGPRRGRGGGGDGPATPRTWNETTAHLGLRFDAEYLGPGWKVKDVILGGPAEQEDSRIAPGEIVMSVDGANVDPAIDPSTVLNGPPIRDIRLQVKNEKGELREVTLRPISFAAARGLLYDAWIKHNQQMVEKASDGKLGYVHIQAMDQGSQYKFERELYAVGAGKDGLVIDVRENGGGSTTDHLLTMLTQPLHAVTVPRGGGPGYPQDRTVYATWRKPIVVLCNQNSFSNAEIFSHAIKTLKRGELVGVPTAGAVISTGGRPIMDVGFIRLPFRGWYAVDTGQDMELNGAVPHHVLWPQPGELPAGKDVQLDKAIEILTKSVEEYRSRPLPKLVKASERGQQQPMAAGK